MNNISIIGGGIGGLFTALCLDKLGVNYKLYERVEVLKEVGAGIWLSPNALQVIQWIDPKLLEEIQSIGNTFDRILIGNHKLKPISDSKQEFIHKKFGYTTMAIHRGTLQKILYSYSNKENIILGKSFHHYKQNDDQSYTVNFLDKTSVTTHSIIGADGINSAVRKQLFPESKLRYSGQTCWRGVSNYELDPSLASTGFTLWGKKLQFGVSKIAQGKTYWFAVKLSKPNLKDDKEMLLAQLEEMFSEFAPVVNKLIKNTSIDNIIRGDISDLELLKKWYSDNICLIGDAAHSMTPDLGQGGAQAIEDAFYLSNFIKISKDVHTAFKEFHSYRKVKVEKLVKQSRTTSKIAITSRPMEIIRNFIFKYTPESFMQKQMIASYSLDQTIFKTV